MLEISRFLNSSELFARVFFLYLFSTSLSLYNPPSLLSPLFEGVFSTEKKQQGESLSISFMALSTQQIHTFLKLFIESKLSVMLPLSTPVSLHPNPTINRLVKTVSHIIDQAEYDALSTALVKYSFVPLPFPPSSSTQAPCLCMCVFFFGNL